MSRLCDDLSGLPWEFGHVGRQPYGTQPADDRRNVAEWLPACVPGDVRADLIAAGRIPPVESPEGIAQGRWVDERDWWYRTTLQGGLHPTQVAILEADGIDYFSAVWLDGKLLSTHAGMAARQWLSLSPAINEPGPHELAIRLWGGGIFDDGVTLTRRASHWVVDRMQPGIDLLSPRMATAKAQFSFGWDFSPRLLSTGIWDDIRVVRARGAYIADLWAYGEPLSAKSDPTPANWHLRLTVRSWQTQTVRLEITLEPENFGGAGYQSLTRMIELSPQESPPYTREYDFELEMAVAHRWWPWDQGEPCLYRVTARLYDDDGLMDAAAQTAGVRSVQRTPLSGRDAVGSRGTGALTNAPWQFMINHRPVFLRGANWVPADILPGRVKGDDYIRLLDLARAAGVNFLRVWGGGVREKRAFWDRCDRLGIMAWQEFPLACDFLESYSADTRYLDELAAEARGTVRALRSHPSLIAWCGGNEINLRREALQLGRLARVVTRHDPTRPWIPASPTEGDVHQWDVWHGLAPWTRLADQKVPFMSEFGLQSLPDPATISEMFPHKVPASLRSAGWGERKAQADKLLHYIGGDGGLEWGPLAQLTQRVQATALQLGVETCRMRRETCGGVAIWQFDEPWPAVSWAVIDRAGRPKAAYQALARSYQPLLIMARFRWQTYARGDTFAADVWVVNDLAEGQSDCIATAAFDGQTVWQSDPCTVTAASACPIGRFSVVLGAAPATLSLDLVRDGRSAGSNCYDLTVPLPRAVPTAHRVRRWLTGRFTRGE